MASKVLALLTWQNKAESLKSFLALNLSFYLVVLGGYSLVSLLSSVMIVFVLIINAHSLVHKTEFEADNFEFLKRDDLEDLLVELWKTWKSLKDDVEASSAGLVVAILAVYFFNFWAGLFGIPALAWVLVNLGFLAGPQYQKNQELIHKTVQEARETVAGVQQMLFELIPKHRASN